MHHLFTMFVIANLFGPLPPGTVSFTTGFPLAIPKTGLVLVNGRVNPGPGFALSSARILYFQDGAEGHMRTVSLDARGKIGPTYISGMTPGAEHNVVLDVVLSSKGQEVTLRTISRVRVR